MIRHSGFFKWKDGVDKGAVERFIAEHNRGLIEVKEIREWQSGHGIEPAIWMPGSFDYGFTCTMEDRAALQRYMEHPWRVNLAKMLVEVRDNVLPWDFTIESETPARSRKDGAKGIRHNVFIKWKEGASQEDRRAWIDWLNRGPIEDEEIRAWHTGHAMGSPIFPSVYDFGLSCVLDDRPALERYANHPWRLRLQNEFLPAVRGSTIVFDFEIENEFVNK